MERHFVDGEGKGGDANFGEVVQIGCSEFGGGRVLGEDRPNARDASIGQHWRRRERTQFSCDPKRQNQRRNEQRFPLFDLSQKSWSSVVSMLSAKRCREGQSVQSAGWYFNQRYYGVISTWDECD